MAETQAHHGVTVSNLEAMTAAVAAIGFTEIEGGRYASLATTETRRATPSARWSRPRWATRFARGSSRTRRRANRSTSWS